MERKTITSLLILVVVIGFQVGESDAFFKKFKKCLKECAVQCAIPPWTAACPASCLAKCIIHPSVAVSSNHEFCTLGCATSSCSKLMTPQNLNLDEVEGCVDGCSETCRLSYVPKNRWKWVFRTRR